MGMFFFLCMNTSVTTDKRGDKPTKWCNDAGSPDRQRCDRFRQPQAESAAQAFKKRPNEQVSVNATWPHGPGHGLMFLRFHNQALQGRTNMQVDNVTSVFLPASCVTCSVFFSQRLGHDLPGQCFSRIRSQETQRLTSDMLGWVI